jgi:hypothetical protein
MSEEENIELVKIVEEYSILCDWKFFLVLQEMQDLNLPRVFLYKLI